MWITKTFVRRRIVLIVFLSIILIFLFRIALMIAGRDFIYLVRQVWDTPPKVPENIIAHFYAEGMSPHDLCPLHGWTPTEAEEPSVIDAFIFSIELDMLEIRLKELWNVVDIFLIVEADRTFTGKRKPLYFSENKERFAWANEKILHFVVNDLSEHPQKEFDNEAKMRGYMSRYIRSTNPKSGDLVIVSDIDEIPYSHTIQLLKSCKGYPKELHLEMDNYIYSFEFKLQTNAWRPHVNIFESSTFFYHHGRNESSHILADAGWHCSFCFRHISDFIFKMTSYSHSDRVTKGKLLDKKEIQRKICEGTDIFDMLPEAYTFLDLFSQMGNVPKSSSTIGIPKYVVEDPVKFHFLLPGGCIRENESM